MAGKSNKEVAAALFGCEPEELIKFREGEDGAVVIIAPTGQKFVYSAEQLEAKREKMKPTPKPRARRAPKTKRVSKPKEVAKPAAKPKVVQKSSAFSSNDEKKH